MRFISVLVLVVALLTETVLGQSALTVLVDRSGSMADQARIEQEMAEALAVGGAGLGRLDVVFFGDLVMSAPATPVVWEADRRWTSPIGPIRIRAIQRLQELAFNALDKVLGDPHITAAQKTNIRTVVSRAGRSFPGALVLTDGKHELAAQPTEVTNAKIVVVLCRAQGDATYQEEDIFDHRKAAILKWAPNALIFQCFEKKDAVRAWLTPPHPERVDASFRK